MIGQLTPYIVALAVSALLLTVIAFLVWRYRHSDARISPALVVWRDMRDAVVVLDAQARVRDVNLAAQELLGKSAKEQIGQPVERVLPYPDLTRGCRTTTEKQMPITAWHGETVRYFDAHILPLRGPRDQITGWLIVLHDVTEHWLAEFRQTEAIEELRRAKQAAEVAHRAKSVSLAHMSHELRTPLRAILGSTEMMARDDNLTPTLRANLRIIARSSRYLMSLLNNLLELSEIETGGAEPAAQAFDLEPLLDDVEEMFRQQAEAKGLEYAVEHAPRLPARVRADEGKLRQVLVNLLENAVKFTERGRVTVRVSIGADPVLYFQVEDTGIGIPPEQQETTFDAFVQLAHGRQLAPGTGLGLAISQQLVQLMGGKLTVRSRVGQGSCFSFYVPVHVFPQAALHSRADLRNNVRRGLNQGESSYA